MKSPPVEKEKKAIKPLKLNPCGQKMLKQSTQAKQTSNTLEDDVLKAFSGFFSSSSSRKKERKKNKETWLAGCLRLIIERIGKFLLHHPFWADSAMKVLPPIEVWRKDQLQQLKSYCVSVNEFHFGGLNFSHFNEFTSFALYMEFDYTDLMRFSERLFAGMFKHSIRSNHDSYPNGFNEESVKIDLCYPFRRISMIDELEKMANLNIPKDFYSQETNTYLIDACTKYGITCAPPLTTARLLDKLVANFLVESCVNPTFIIDYPEIMCPLAKRHRCKPGLTESFKLFINKHEFCNGHAALEDPMLYRERYLEQLKDCQCGDDGLMSSDAVLQHGLPPTGGWSLTISRFIMLVISWHAFKERASTSKSGSSSKDSESHNMEFE